MREIKFRAKTIFGAGEWVYGYYAVNEGKHYIYENDGPTLIVPETVGQWTGLKGKNGIEIYEGDIVEYEDYSGAAIILGKNKPKRKSVIKWSNFYNGYYLRGLPHPFKGEKLKVIGNIYENPELLGDEE